MRIYEVVSNQNIVNEQILTEIDWKKLRNALIGGAMSLAVLGSPGKAIAQSLDANKITPDQAIELLQKKLASGEIRPDQLQNLNKTADIKKTEPNKTVPPTVKQDEPKKTDIIDNTNLSDFSVKGIKFGMSIDQVADITGDKHLKKSYEYQSPFQKNTKEYKQDMDTWNKLNGRYPHKMSPTQDELDAADLRYFETPKNWSELLHDYSRHVTKSKPKFSIAGIDRWKINYVSGLTFDTTKLTDLTAFIDPNEFDNYVKIFTGAYGQPKMSSNAQSTKLNYKVMNQTARWNVKDTTIEIQKYVGKVDEGGIFIVWNKTLNDLDKKKQQTTQDKKKDF